MVKKIDYTIFVFVRSFLHLLVHLFDHSFVHLFVCSCGCLVLWSFDRFSAGRVLGRSFVRLVVWSVGRLFVFGSLTFMRS